MLQGGSWIGVEGWREGRREGRKEEGGGREDGWMDDKGVSLCSI